MLISNLYYLLISMLGLEFCGIMPSYENVCSAILEESLTSFLAITL